MQREKEQNIVCISFFSWGPIFLGGLIGMGLGFLLDLFGTGIGLSSYTTDTNGATTLAIGGFIGLIIGAIATMFPAGFAAGYFAAPTCRKRNFGVVYGFAAWAVGLLLMAVLASSVNVTTSNYAKAVPTIATSTANEVMTTTQNVTSRVHPATDASDTNVEKRVRAAGLISLSMFMIFFVGALSACVGGYYGFYCWDKNEDKYKTY